jgi:hypothetical protein
MGAAEDDRMARLGGLARRAHLLSGRFSETHIGHAPVGVVVHNVWSRRPPDRGTGVPGHLSRRATLRPRRENRTFV